MSASGGSRKSKLLKKQKHVILDTIELSSEEDASQSVSLMSVSVLEKTVRTLREENKRLTAQATQVEKQAEELKAQISAARESLNTQKNTLENLGLSSVCQVCDQRMWQPSVLPCGHAFCEGCIEEWFRKILTNYCEENEGWDPRSDLLEGFLECLHEPYHSESERNQILHELRDLYVASPKPTYTCPMCRETITSPPVRCVWAKGIVAELARWEGEQEEANVKQDVPWELFFPLYKLSYF